MGRKESNQTNKPVQMEKVSFSSISDGKFPIHPVHLVHENLSGFSCKWVENYVTIQLLPTKFFAISCLDLLP